jgi:hypothetical protein
MLKMMKKEKLFMFETVQEGVNQLAYEEGNKL